MKRLIKTILIVCVVTLGLGLFAAPSARAIVVDELVVEYSSDRGNNWLPFSAAIFSETNFLPGEGVSRWVKVTNNSGDIQRIATQPLTIIDLNRLGDVLNLEIKEGGVIRYSNALSSFFAGGENYLSSLANSATTQYDFTVSFYSGSQNTFQGKSLSFDIIIGFQGEEGGILPGAGSTSGGSGGGGGGGGVLLSPGLTIQNEAIATTTATSVTLFWTTSYPATSQVIYALEGEKHLLDLTDSVGAPPKYGYERTTPESDISPKVISHLVTINGLTPGAKYYYRTVSHASLAISGEHSFTTLEETAKEELFGEQINFEGITSGGETVSIQPEEKENILSSEKIIGEEENIDGSAEIKTNVQGLEENKSFLGKIGNLAASLFFGFSDNKWPLFIIWLIFFLVVLILIFLFKKKQNNQK